MKKQNNSKLKIFLITIFLIAIIAGAYISLPAMSKAFEVQMKDIQDFVKAISNYIEYIKTETLADELVELDEEFDSTYDLNGIEVGIRKAVRLVVAEILQRVERPAARCVLGIDIIHLVELVVNTECKGMITLVPSKVVRQREYILFKPVGVRTIFSTQIDRIGTV